MPIYQIAIPLLIYPQIVSSESKTVLLRSKYAYVPAHMGDIQEINSQIPGAKALILSIVSFK